jgi:sensor histidine kinase regulating citrate/malate metabolism
VSATIEKGPDNGVASDFAPLHCSGLGNLLDNAFDAVAYAAEPVV